MSHSGIIRRVLTKARKRSLYYLQKATNYRFDSALESRLAEQTETLLAQKTPPSKVPDVRRASDFDLDDASRFALVRPDIYKTFEASDDGPDRDEFERPGTWISRGVLIHEDLRHELIIKSFPPSFCHSGEGRFIEPALEAGFYAHLCPLLEFLIRDDDGNLVGYAIKKGRILTHYDFERYVDRILRPLICKATEKSGYYFYDLIDHNVITRDGIVSLIDIESVLPVEWYGKPKQFAASKLDLVDVGWPLQTKWRSPDWYARFIRKLQTPSTPA